MKTFVVGWSDGEYRYWGLALRPGWFLGVVRMVGAGKPADVLAPYERRFDATGYKP